MFKSLGMTMRKWLIGLIIIIAVLLVIFLGAPFGLSFWVKYKYEQMFSRYSQPTFHLQLVRFKRGWFTSHAKVQVLLRGNRALAHQLSGMIRLVGQGQQRRFVIDSTIKQGPVIFSRYANCSAVNFG